MEQETILGFDIPVRKLTDEEYNRPVTKERFDNFHHDAGEDFCDTCGSIINEKILGGFLMAKHPEKASDFLKVLNDKYSEALSLKHVYDDTDGIDDEFYTDLAEFINLTTVLKGRVNQILIQLDEHYTH